MKIEEEYPNVCTLTQEEMEENPYCDGDHKAAFYKIASEKAHGFSRGMKASSTG